MFDATGVDGCFDMMHFGHANAIRQAKKLFPKVELFVGVHTDEDIKRHKGICNVMLLLFTSLGPPVMNEQERYEAVRSCKWVDHVIEGAPYVRISFLISTLMLFRSLKLKF